MSLVGLLILILILGLLIYVVGLLPLPQPFKNVATIIVCLIAILYLVGYLGHGPSLTLR